MNRLTFGERLKMSRKNAGLTQERVAEAAGITGGAISQLESGTTNGLACENLFPIAEVLGVNPKWLATGFGPIDGRDCLSPVSVLGERLARQFDSLDSDQQEVILVMAGKFSDSHSF